MAAVHAPLPRVQTAMAPADLDRLLAPVALYPDQLLGQILICSQNPGSVDALNLWMGKNPTLKAPNFRTRLSVRASSRVLSR